VNKAKKYKKRSNSIVILKEKKALKKINANLMDRLLPKQKKSIIKFQKGVIR